MPNKFDAHAPSAPCQACLFVRPDAVRFSDESGEKGASFEIVGYSGEVIPNHWFWDNLAFDLAGLTFAQERTPVLDSHFTDRRLGFTTKQDIGETVHFEGRFLSNDHAQQFRRDMQEGFPMQASLFCPPSAIERVREGESVAVNGRTLQGPGTVFRKAAIKEVSMCVFGADAETSAAAFAATDKQITFTVKESTMDQETATPETPAMTVAHLKTQFADVHAEVLAAGKAEGTRAERDRFATLQAVCGDDTELLVQCFTEGHGEIDALKLRNTRLADQLAEASKHKATPPVDPAITEFNEQVPGQRVADAQKPATFMAAVAKFQSEHGVSKSEAVSKCVDLYPDLHAAMTEGGA